MLISLWIAFVAFLGFGKAFFSQEVIVLNDENFDALVRNSKEAWLIDYYAPWCGHCRQMKDSYSKAALELQGKAKVGAVDCTAADSQALCRERNIQGFPTLYIWPVSQQGNRESPILYQFARTKEAFVNSMLPRIPTFALRNITSNGSENWEAFLGTGETVTTNSIPKVLFLSNQPNPAHLFLGLSAAFHGSIEMAFASVEKARKFSGISSFPAAILVGKDGKRTVLTGAQQLKYAHIFPLLKQMLSVAIPLHEIESQTALDNALSNAGNSLCIIGFLALEEAFPESVEEFRANYQILSLLSSKYPQIHFMWINPMKHAGLIRKLGISDVFPQAVLLKPKKKFYRILKAAFDVNALSSVIDGVLTGKGNVKEYSGELLLDVQQSKKPSERNPEDL